MPKSALLTKTGLLAVTALLMVGATGCTNSEAPAPSTDASGEAVPSLGEGGQEAAQGVEADPAVEAMLPADVKEAGSMQLVTDPTYAPLDFTDDTGKIVGLEPDMALAVANRMGIEIDITKGDFNGILAGLQ